MPYVYGDVMVKVWILTMIVNSGIGSGKAMDHIYFSNQHDCEKYSHAFNEKLMLSSGISFCGEGVK